MNNRFSIMIGIVFLIPIVIVSSSDHNVANGLECRSPDMNRSVENADVIFSGEAISKEYVEPSDESTLVGITLFSVTEQFKGAYQDTIRISSDERFWGFNFAEGSEYVVFARIAGDDIKHNLCTPTSLVEHADVDLIRKISQDHVLPPLKQFNLKVSADKIQCKTSLELVARHDGTPACVKHQTAEKLIERGWLFDPGLVSLNPDDQKPATDECVHVKDGIGMPCDSVSIDPPSGLSQEDRIITEILERCEAGNTEGAHLKHVNGTHAISTKSCEWDKIIYNNGHVMWYESQCHLEKVRELSLPECENKDKMIAGFEYLGGTRLTVQEQEDYCEERNAFRTGPNACQYNIHPSDCSDGGFDYKRGNCNPDY